MLRFVWTLVWVVVLFFQGYGRATLRIYDLSCENLTNPLGIGTVTPALSWKIGSVQNETSQLAWQILAATDSTLLREDKADLWNSGKTAGSSQVLVSWQGKPLGANTFVYWKVRIWDQHNKPSGWSNTAVFSVGLLTEKDWHADYIGLPGGVGNPESPQLRKRFFLKGKSKKRVLHVNSLGYHEIFINGQKISDAVLSPAVSQFTKRSLSIVYDVSAFLREGPNDLVIWLGRGWYAPDLPGVNSEGPLVRAQLMELLSGTWSPILSTDKSWMCRESGYSCIGNWKPNNFGGERVDGSRLLADLKAETLDQVSWHPVFVADIPEHLVTPQAVEQNRIMQKIRPASVRAFGADTWLVDMGKTLTGWAEIHFPVLQPGQVVKMEYCDHLDKDSLFVNQHQEDGYIAKGGAREMFCNKFNYHGFRYIKITNLDVAPKIEDISAFLIHTAYRQASSFECSDSDLNQIHDMLFYTLRCLSLGGYLVDCPQLERLGYGGDGNASTMTAQTMFNLAPLYANWLQAWGDCIREDGGMPHTAPNPYPAGGGPYWCGFIISASWKTYLNYGDVRFLEKYYPVMQQWLGYVAKYTTDGLLQPWPDTAYRNWYLGDWATPSGVDQKNKASINLVNNCYLVECYETMEKIARILGRTTDAKKYNLQNEQLKERIHTAFFDAKKYSYASGSQIDLTYPLLTNVVNDSMVANVTNALTDHLLINKNGHVACGLVGIPVFTEWTVKNKETQIFYDMLKKPDYPGYLYMIQKGATTTWEHWAGERSRIHNCYNGIGTWFYQAVGGILPDENFPGYQHVTIDPQIPDGITWAKATKETPYGLVGVDWKLENSRLEFKIRIPAGCKASVVLPDQTVGYVLNGRNYTPMKGADGVHVTIGSGQYTLSCEYKRSN